MEFQTDKKTALSGAQPSGNLTIGNYLGALRNWVTLQNELCEEYNFLYCVMDMHAITVRQVPADLRRRTLETVAIYMACGIDPEKSLLFVQSHVPAHAQLGWVLDCYTMFGELSRMTQFKDKSAKNAQNINAGLFTYPALMAADILLYQADLVPVGLDQKQHIEITRDIAERFNQIYGDTFVIPEGYIPETGTKICSLADPLKKMSKSDDNPNGCVLMLDPRDDIIRKFKRAVTDSDTAVRYAEGKDGINNLMSIYSCCTGASFDEIEREFEGKGYGDFKTKVGEAVIEELTPVRENFNRIVNDKAYLTECMAKGAETAQRISERTLNKAMKKVGFLLK